MRRLELFAVTASFCLALGCTYYDGHCEPDPWDDRCLFGDCPSREDAGVSVDRDATTRDASIGECVDHTDCAPGRACVAHRCEIALSCETDLDCPAADLCDERGTCVPRPVEPRCTGAADCATEEVCVGGACTPVAEVCLSDLDCGPGRGCVDNECRPLCLDDAECDSAERCVAAHCVPVAECENDRECPGEICVGGRCSGTCTGDGECGAHERCETGLCLPDVAPRSFCDTDDDCAAGHPCVDGVCRTVCPSGLDDECQRADVQLVTCASVGTRLLCLARSETDPECRVETECDLGEHCIDAMCR